MKTPDLPLSSGDQAEIERYARFSLDEANARGRFPTPVKDIVAAAKLTVAKGITLDDGFFKRLLKEGRHKAKQLTKQAIGKLYAFLDIPERRIHLAKDLHPKKRKFVTLHDAAHFVFPWQREVYTYLEEDELTLDPDVQELFEAQANAFATEVLFQCGGFENDAADSAPALQSVLDLSARYGSSRYAAARRFVSRSHRACALVVLENRAFDFEKGGYTADLRRWIPSAHFTKRFGSFRWPARFGPEHAFMKFVFSSRFPLSDARHCTLVTSTKEKEPCMVQAFNTGYQVLVLVVPECELRGSGLLMRPARAS